MPGKVNTENKHQPTKLKERLREKHDKTLQSFQEAILELNDEVDTKQIKRICDLKKELAASHALVKDILEQEKQLEAQHLMILERQEKLCENPSEEDVLPELVDMFHKEKDQKLKQSAHRIEQERFRLLHIAVKIRALHSQRLDMIKHSVQNLEAEEQDRREKIQELLRELMLDFAKISYVGVTTSHVIAQQIIHNVNEQLVENFLGCQTLLTQLSKREVLSQRQYGRQMADLYREALARMVRSQMIWVTSRLHSALFRRPASRMQVVERVNALSGTVQRDVKTFLDSIGVVVTSLRTSTPGPQACGGSGSSGWLRAYSPNLADVQVFTDDPQQVVEEWIMKANVMIRNSLTSCLTLSEFVSQKERELAHSAQELRAFLLSSMESIHTPLEQEIESWQESSLLPNDMDECFRPFVARNMEAIVASQVEAEKRVGASIESVRCEGDWFAETVRNGLQRSHSFLEEALVLRVQSIMRLFDCSTGELTETATQILGFLRQFYWQQFESVNDTADKVAKYEEKFLNASQRLSHAGSITSSEELFAEALYYLDKIAKIHGRHHKDTVNALSAVKGEFSSHFRKYAHFLTEKIGLEEVNDTIQRLETERNEKVQSTYARLIEEQQAAINSSNNKSGKNSNNTNNSATLPEMESITLSMIEESIPIEVPNYPQLKAPDGTIYNIIKEMNIDPLPALVSPSSAAGVLSPQKGGAQNSSNNTKGNKDSLSAQSPMKVKRVGSGRKKEAEAVEVEKSEVLTVSPKFEQAYLPMFSDTIQNSENFISNGQVEEWVQMLRVELMQWMRKLAKDSSQELEQYCSTKKSEIDQKTNEILRNHRRRPARFQAELFEGRVRELENTSNTFEKHCARLLERASKINAIWATLHSNQSWMTDDEKILRELGSLKEKADATSTAAALQVQERRFAALTEQFLNNFERRSKELKTSIYKQKDSLMSECSIYLNDRTKQLSEEVCDQGVGISTVIDNDPLVIRVRGVMEQLESMVEKVEEQSKKEEEQRKALVEEHRNEYEVIYKRNNAELVLLAMIQEALARIKAQVQSAIHYSNSSEEKLLEIIVKLEQCVQKTIQQTSLTKTMSLRLQHDYSLDTSPVPPNKEYSTDMMHEEEDRLGEKLMAAKTQFQRLMKAGDTANILGLLDTLREHLYVRGVALNTLINSVDFVQISPDYYVEPKPLPKEAYENAANGKGKKSKPFKNNTVVIYDPLPTASSIESVYRKWADEVRDEVKNAANTHFTTYPPPLSRRLQGMRGGQLSDLIGLTDTLCEQQERRIQEHVKDATKRFHQQVQRVNLCVHSVPQYLVATAHSLAVAAIEKRAEAVLQSFGNLFSYSSALKTVHQGELKVSMGHKVHRDKLELLSVSECNRQQLTMKTIQQYWGFILRELQDEAGLHSVRCACVTNNFFYLLKGLITPLHLLPCESDISVGQHRGLKHLMRMRDRERQLKEIEVATEHPERHLQETMPLMKQDMIRKSSKHGSVGGGTLISLTQKEIEYDGLPLNELRPLEEFNTEHAECAVSPLPSAHSFYIFQDVPLATAGTGPAVGGGGKAAAPSSTRKSKNKNAAATEGVIAYTPPFSAPKTTLHQETVALSRESVTAFLSSLKEVSEVAAKTFGKWCEREEQWKTTWEITVAQVSDGEIILNGNNNNNNSDNGSILRTDKTTK